MRWNRVLAMLTLTVLLTQLACRPREDERAGSDSSASPPRAGLPADSAILLARAYLAGTAHRSEYLMDSTRVIETDSSWQVFVRRTDWEVRRPPEALIEVNRSTGAARQVPLK